LIEWSIDVAKGVPDICDILVSTDDSAIAGVARNAGALVPWLRPAELATDMTSSVDVCLHALDWYEGGHGNVDGLLLLQPTSPFRSRDTVVRGIELFRVGKHRAVIGVAPSGAHPMWCFRIEGQTFIPFIDRSSAHLRSQDLPPAYVVNGAFYLVAPEDLRKLRSFITDEAIALVVEEPQEGIDIDSEWDWKVAEIVVAMANTGHK
jgi:N-acylneuraminate cytidylyltransferase